MVQCCVNRMSVGCFCKTKIINKKNIKIFKISLMILYNIIERIIKIHKFKKDIIKIKNKQKL